MTADTPEEALAHFVDAATEGVKLAALLSERLPLYEGRGANQVIRMRGYILAAFERTGLPGEALPYVLEELESGHSAYLVAAAAKAARGMEAPPADLPAYLLKAARNIRQKDDAVTFEQYKPDWPAANPTSALREIFRTLAWLGARGVAVRAELEKLAAEGAFSPGVTAELRLAVEASAERQAAASPAARPCCATKPLMQIGAARPVGGGIRLQDQDGRQVPLEEFFRGKPSIAVFFYTRCNNPNKCSLTITRLARLQQELAEQNLDVRTAAITYDPDFDLPERLKGYGLARGIRFAEDHRFFRAHTGFAELSERWDLGVNYSDATVNHHRIELLILDAAGRVAHQHTRMQWEPAEVTELAREVLNAQGTLS
jgi:cytochrome oxidase Cu insertion factor (SCO1/SenC/PrrC family)